MNYQLNIIVVEDNDALREVTVEALLGEGHLVTGVDCAEAIVDKASIMPVDLMVIDLNLPGESGLGLTRRIRQSQPDIGIIMVTARGQLAEKKEGYESGADIYLTKPTSVEELGAAIKALARRIKPAAQVKGALRLNLNNLSILGLQNEVKLTMPEATLLSAFICAPQNRVENWQLIELLSKDDAKYSKSNLEAHLARLRKKLVLAGAHGGTIKAIRQVGYQLCVPFVIV